MYTYTYKLYIGTYLYACVCIHTCITLKVTRRLCASVPPLPAHVSIRQPASAYGSIRQNTSHTLAYGSIRHHTAVVRLSAALLPAPQP